MSDDIQQLDKVQENLLTALNLASSVADNIQGGDEAAAKDACASFLKVLEASQVALLQIVERHEAPLPLATDGSDAKLLAAAQYRKARAALLRAASAAQPPADS